LSWLVVASGQYEHDKAERAQHEVHHAFHDGSYINYRANQGTREAKCGFRARAALAKSAITPYVSPTNLTQGRDVVGDGVRSGVSES